MNWSIEITNFLGGFAPAWYKETYPSYGNKNQAGSMLNIDLTNPGYLTQGPGLADLTAGTQADAVTTLIKGIADLSVASDVTYGVGGNKLYKISSTAVTNAGAWPHTIDKATVTAELGESVCFYKGALYYTYNHSGSLGDIGKFDLNATFDDDWGSTVPSGASTLATGPHQAIAGGNDNMYIANGRYICSFDNTTLIPQALDFPVDSVVNSIAWMSDRIWCAVNRPNLSGANKNTASIYVWDGTTDSWEAEIRVMGYIGALYVKNGILYVFYRDISSTGGYKLAYVSGSTIVDLANYPGAVPEFYQVTDYKDFIIWSSDGALYAFGAGDKDMPTRLFQLGDAGYATVGGLVCPFGTVMVASTDGGSNFRLAKFSGYDVNSNWKSLMFDITANGQVSKIEKIRINFEQLQTGARVDWKLLNNKGVTIYSDTISYAKLGAVTTHYYPINGKVEENFRIEFDYTNGDTTNTVKIKSAKIYGSAN